MAHDEAYRDPGTPEEQSRRQFMANAVVAMGGVISIALVIPLLTSLIPSDSAGEGAWSKLTPEEYAKLQKVTDQPVKVTFDVNETDGYLPAADVEEFVWAIKTTPDAMEKARPELFSGPAKLPYPVVVMGFTVFSPICPHLGCRYTWFQDQNKFICPCHGSQYSELGAHEAGPAPRGLDPLPLQFQGGDVEVTWIEYKQNTPDHIILRVA